MLKNTSARRKKWASILAFASIPLSGFVTDIYLPSFPTMARELQVPESSIQLTLTCYLLSYGVSQLFVGSILDSLGRYKAKLWSLFFVIISSILITCTDSILLICILRILQGLAISFLVVATRALFVDIFKAEEVKGYLSYFTIVWSCGPIIAPFLGGYLEELFSWHYNFYFLSFYALILLLFELKIGGESLAEKKKINLPEIMNLYCEMLGKKVFIQGIIIQGISYSLVMIFNITGPFLIEDIFKFNSVAIGYCTLILGFSWMIGGIIGKKRMHLPYVKSIMLPSILQLILISILLVLGITYQNLYLLIFFAFFIHICSGVLFTSFFTTSMLHFPKNAGIAGGLMGGLVYVITSITSFIISYSGKVNSQNALSWRYFIFSGLLFIVILWMYQSVKKQVTSK